MSTVRVHAQLLFKISKFLREYLLPINTHVAFSFEFNERDYGPLTAIITKISITL